MDGYTPLTQEQFQKLRTQGFTPEKIIEFEQRRKSETKPHRVITGEEFGKVGRAITLAPVIGPAERIIPESIKQKIIPERFARGIGRGITRFGSEAAFGLPALAAKKAGIEIEPAESLEEQTAELIGGIQGFMKGGALKIGTKAAGKLIKEVPRKVGFFTARGLPLKKQIAKGAIEFGTAGALQLEEDPTIVGQVARGVTGATLGALFPLGQAGLRKGVRAFRRLRRPVSETVVERLRKAKLTATEKATKMQLERTRAFEDAKQILDTNKKILIEELQTNAETGSLAFQKRLPEFYRTNSQAYGQALDDIGERLAKEKTRIMVGEIDDIIQISKQEAAEAGVSSTKLDKFIQKYSPRGAEGEMLRSPNDILNFKEIIKDIRNLGKTLQVAVREGKRRFTEDDIIVSIFRKNWGEFISQRAPEFAELQQAYRPIIQTMNLSNKIFRPYRGEFETKTGTALLRRFGLKQTELSEEKLIEAVQKGGGFGEGIGDITQKIRATGQRISAIGKRLDEMEIVDVKVRRKIEDELARRLALLEGRNDIAAQLLRNKKRAEILIRGLTYIGSVAGAYWLGRGAAEIGKALSNR